MEAWAICSRHEGTFDLFVSPALHGTPAHEIVMDEYVAWAEARARETGVKQISPFWATYAQFIGSAVYDGARDLFVRSPDGRGASACTIWFDPVNAVGLFEPVATHPDFQGQGLGKAVMAEGLRRMKAAGMRRAIVGFDPTNAAALALYTSMGFRASCYFVGYRKALETPPF